MATGSYVYVLSTNGLMKKQLIRGVAPCFNTFRFPPHSPSFFYKRIHLLSPSKYTGDSLTQSSVYIYSSRALYMLGSLAMPLLSRKCIITQWPMPGPLKNHQQHSPITVHQHPPACTAIRLPFSGNREGDQDISPSGEVRPSTRVPTKIDGSDLMKLRFVRLYFLIHQRRFAFLTAFELIHCQCVASHIVLFLTW